MIADERVEELRNAAARARANGNPDKYLAGLSVQQAHDIADCLAELQRFRAQPAAEAVWDTLMDAIKPTTTP